MSPTLDDLVILRIVLRVGVLPRSPVAVSGSSPNCIPSVSALVRRIDRTTHYYSTCAAAKAHTEVGEFTLCTSRIEGLQRGAAHWKCDSKPKE